MRVIAAAIAGWVAFAAVSVQAAPSPNQKNWLQLGATLSSTWETKPAATVGTRASGATGSAIGGGVPAFRVGTDLTPHRVAAPMTWAMQAALILGCAAGCLGRRVRDVIRRGVMDAISDDIPGGDHRCHGD
jgi:hypothetical protein